MRALATYAVMAAAALALAGCGGGARQDEDEPEGDFRVEVVDASFPARQSIAERSTMSIQVRNADRRTVPNVAVTVETKPREPGGAPVAFGENEGDPRFSDPGRPVWVVDSAPEGGTTAYTNTWALGRLAPGQTKTFSWRVTAVQPGRYRIAYRVSPGLSDRVRLARGTGARGSFRVTVVDEPVPARVDDKGNVVRGEKPGGGAAGAGGE